MGAGDGLNGEVCGPQRVAHVGDVAREGRLVAGELQMADVRQQVVVSLPTDFENYSIFKPSDYHLAALNTLLDQVVDWSTALAPLRAASLAA